MVLLHFESSLIFVVMNLFFVTKKLYILFCFRQTATLVVEHGVVLKFKPGRGIHVKGRIDYFLIINNMKPN